MKLKKVARFTGRCVLDFTTHVLAKSFAAGFIFGSFAYHYWRWPDGSREMVVKFVAENEQRLEKTVNAWFDKHSSEDDEDEWREEDLWFWERNLNDLEYQMLVWNASDAEFEILENIKKHAIVDHKLEYCRDIVYYHELKDKYGVKEDDE